MKLRLQIWFYSIVELVHYIMYRTGFICRGWSGPCFNFGKEKHRHTNYHEDHLNYAVLCKDCYDAEYEYFDELWKEYRRGQGV